MGNASEAVLRVLAVDPGRAKCGVAVVSHDEGVLHRAVVPIAELAMAVDTLAARYGPELIVVGNGTGSAGALQAILSAIPDGPPVECVEESHTSEIARTRYLAEHPARGLGRLIPMGLRTPSEPYDDYVAVILAERRLARPAAESAGGQNGR